MLAILLFVACFTGFLASPGPNVRKIDPYIVGGSPAKPGEFPWLVLVMCEKGKNSYSFCAGTIINKNWIMTTAFCPLSCTSKLSIAAGGYYLYKVEKTEQLVNVSKVIPHEEYNNVTKMNNIAVLKLATSLTFNTNVQPGKIAGPATKVDSNLVVAGWGRTQENGEPSDTLLKVTVPLLPPWNCTESRPEHTRGTSGALAPGPEPGWASGRAQARDLSDFDDASQICAGAKSKGSCGGDQGGPLHNLNDKTVVGVVSHGWNCGKDGKPSVYGRVSYYAAWIASHTK